MTTEDALQKAIDQNPEDMTLRLVYADYLEEQGDPRAEGYRELARIGKRSLRCEMLMSGVVYFIYGIKLSRYMEEIYRTRWGECELPNDWFRILKGYKKSMGGGWRYYTSRRRADAAAALAYLKYKPLASVLQKQADDGRLASSLD